MSDKAYTDGLNYDLIKRAVHGEKDALEEILRIYEPFHNALVTREVVGPDGKIHKEIDEDKKIQVTRNEIRQRRQSISMWKMNTPVSIPAFTQKGTKRFTAALTVTSGRPVCWIGISGAFRMRYRRG